MVYVSLSIRQRGATGLEEGRGRTHVAGKQAGALNYVRTCGKVAGDVGLATVVWWGRASSLSACLIFEIA
jgi:hypothetical protein